MELYQLECFYEVAQGKSFLQVAEDMNLSQSTVSRMVRSLEDELGVLLLDRSGRSAVLSPAGRTLFSELKELLPQIRRMLDHVRSYAGNKSLSFAIVPYTPFLHVKRITRAFCEINPNCKIVRQELETVPEAFDALRNYRIDYLIYHRMYERNTGEFQYAEIYDDRMMLAIPAEHPLALLSEIPLSEIASETLISNKYSYSDIVQIGAAYGVRLNVNFKDLPRVDLLMRVLEQGSIGVIWESETRLFQFSSLVMRPLQVKPIPFVIATRKKGLSDLQTSFLRYFIKEKSQLDHY